VKEITYGIFELSCTNKILQHRIEKMGLTAAHVLFMTTIILGNITNLTYDITVNY